MLKPLISLFSFYLVNVYAAGRFTILHHPPSISFKGHDRIDESLVVEVHSAALGFSTEQGSSWSGMYLRDPFDLPEALVTVYVDGVSNLGQGKGHHYPLKTNDDESDLFYSMQKRIMDHQPTGSSNVVRVDLNNGLDSIAQYDSLKGIKNVKPEKSGHKVLKLSVAEDREFLEEVALLNAITKEVLAGAYSRDYFPDIFWFKVASLHAVSDLHGENSTATKEAKQLLYQAILELNIAFNKAYSGSVLVDIIISDASHTRRARQILQSDVPVQPRAEEVVADLNLAKAYNQDYPVIFNIILWFGVVMVFSLLAICIVIGDMDPGRDSIIYRMTSTRMKKDN